MLHTQSRDGQMSKGEMDFLNSQHKDMRAGGGLYIAIEPYSSGSYVRLIRWFAWLIFGSKSARSNSESKGPCPLEILIKGDSLILLESDLKDSKFKAFFQNLELTDLEKVNLGKLLPFVHNHGGRVGYPSWWVTHNTDVIKSITIGAGKPYTGGDTKWMNVAIPANFKVAFGFQADHVKHSDHKLDSAKVFELFYCLEKNASRKSSFLLAHRGSFSNLCGRPPKRSPLVRRTERSSRT